MKIKKRSEANNFVDNIFNYAKPTAVEGELSFTFTTYATADSEIYFKATDELKLTDITVFIVGNKWYYSCGQDRRKIHSPSGFIINRKDDINKFLEGFTDPASYNIAGGIH